MTELSPVRSKCGKAEESDDPVEGKPFDDLHPEKLSESG